MTNIYFLWKGGTVPSPYTRTLSWDGKFIKFTNSLASHGTTGGSVSHTHSTSYSIGTSASNSIYVDTAGGVWHHRPHTHAAPSSPSGQTSNNNPPYYTLELIYMDLATFESSGILPEGSVVLSTETLSVGGLSRFTEADSKLIKVGIAGNSGGSSTHIHTVTGNTGSNSSSAYINDGMNYTASAKAAHTHSTSITTDSATLLPKRVQTRLYEIISSLSYIPAGIMGFVDGTPSARWEPINWDDHFLESVNSDPTSTGSHTHSQSGSGTTGAYTNSSFGCQAVTTSTTVVRPHDHSITLTLGSVDHQPEYVNLYPVRLISTINRRTFVTGCVTGLW